MLSKLAVDNAIESIKHELAGYRIKPENLAKFGESKEDLEYLSYVNGVGGSYVKFLPLLIQKLGLKKIYELGNREGLSTLAIFDGLPADAAFTTIDIDRDQRYCPEAMFKDPRVKFIFGDVSDLSIFQNNIPTDIDFLFTDTIHFDFQLRDEWAIYQHLLADQALVAIDDINVNDKRKLFDELAFEKWDLTELCHVSGWGLFLFERREQTTREERILKAYQASAAVWRRKFGELHAWQQIEEGKKFKQRLKSMLVRNPKLHEASIAVRKMLGIIK
jgi:predicted O-methyltransferase YrrM